MEEAAKVKRVRNVGYALLIAGTVVVVALRLRGIRYFGPVPTIVIMWVPWMGALAVENWMIRAPGSRWARWAFGAALIVGATIYMSR